MKKWKLVLAIVVAGALVAVGCLALFGYQRVDDSRLLEKPVIYLYPQETTNVRVELNTDADLAFTYPTLGADNAWQVTADPDGTLTDAEGRSYPSLFWDAMSNWTPDMSTGSVVTSQDVVPFLEETLAELGLNERESSDFITYWGPRLTAEPYTLIHFTTGEQVNEMAHLTASPAPDSEIRVFMSYRSVSDPSSVQVQPQQFTTPERTGFVLVEWGGQQLD